MDFKITNVTTVDSDDDEPLLEVKKVTVLTDNKDIGKREVRRVRAPKIGTYRKICFVPLCPNSSHMTPEKMFITVPVNPVRRKVWLDIVGKANTGNPKSPMFCCQDHFNLKTDMKNYEEHLRKGRVQMMLYQTATPHIFLCNDYGHLKKRDRIEVLRKLHAERNEKIELDEDDDELEITHTTRGRKRKQVSNTVFLEMPAYEYDDQSDFVINEDGVDTIVIDDSDSDEF